MDVNFLTGRTEVLANKPVQFPFFPIRNPTRSGMETNPGLYDE